MGIVVIVPIKFKRPSDAPLNSLDATVSEHLGSELMFRVCSDMLEKPNSGLPAVFESASYY